jgi:3-oxoacyl-[acyl-carrier-protein] synthase-3
LENASFPLESIDLILVATMTPEFLCPATSCLIQKELGAAQCAAFDIQAACCGFVYGLELARSLIEAKSFKNILFVAAEKMSAFIDYEDRTTCILFGDGAAAAVISCEQRGFEILPSYMRADGASEELIKIPAGGSRLPASCETVAARQHYLHMQGKEVFKIAVRTMVQSVEECLLLSSVPKEQVKYLVPHQANERILDAVMKQLALPKAQMVKTIDRYGNTSAASIGIALDELMRTTPLQKEDIIALTAAGAGMTWGTNLLRYRGA